jgi:guanine deaminase
MEFEKLTDHLIELASNNAKSGLGGPFSAIILDEDGEIIAEACNEVISLNDPTAHAEIQAIRKASKVKKNFDLSGCTLIASCEPCPMCLSAIYWAKMKKVYYIAETKDAKKSGFDDSFIYEELLKNKNKRKIEMIKLDSAKSKDPFNVWDLLNDKVRY